MNSPNLRYKTRGLPRAPNKRIQPGERFGEWIAIKIISNEQRWLCRCSCGKEQKVLTCSLRNGGSKSCGCIQPLRIKKHGMAGTGTYMIWAWMLQRCNNPNSTGYRWYGGTGIKVCEHWHKFANFFADMGIRPIGMSIDRLDPKGDYCKENCRWATQQQQSNNKRNTRNVTYQGKTLTLKEWARELKMNDQVLYWRYRRNWPVDKLLQAPQKRKT